MCDNRYNHFNSAIMDTLHFITLVRCCARALVCSVYWPLIAVKKEKKEKENSSSNFQRTHFTHLLTL